MSLKNEACRVSFVTKSPNLYFKALLYLKKTFHLIFSEPNANLIPEKDNFRDLHLDVSDIFSEFAAKYCLFCLFLEANFIDSKILKDLIELWDRIDVFASTISSVKLKANEI